MLLLFPVSVLCQLCYLWLCQLHILVRTQRLDEAHQNQVEKISIGRDCILFFKFWVGSPPTLACCRHTANHSGRGQMRMLKEHIWDTGCIPLCLLQCWLHLHLSAACQIQPRLCPICCLSLPMLSLSLTDCWTGVLQWGCWWWDDLKWCQRALRLYTASLLTLLYPYFVHTVIFNYFSEN